MISINPGEKFCEMNKSESEEKVDDSSKNLLEETGMATLNQLYFDKYNYETGEWDKRSPNMQKIFKSDLQELYQAYFKNINAG